MNLLDARVKGFLEEVEARAREVAESFEWATGRLNFNTGILPSVSAAEKDALERLAKQTQSYGPHALDVLKNGTIGSYNWGKGNDDMMRALRLPQLAIKFHLQGRVTGMMAGHVYTPEGGLPRIQRLGGYIEPLRDPDDVDYEWGLYQAIPTHLGGDGLERWRVRIFDLEEKTLYEWENLRNAYEIGVVPEPRRDVLMPRYIILSEDVDGLPYGEFMAALPLLKGELSAQMRSDRAAEATSSPQLVIKGEAEGYEMRGPTRVVLIKEGGDAYYLKPGDLAALHASHDRKLERLRLFLNLPGATGLGGQLPSGEALKEANLKYTSSCKLHADALGDLLTDLVADHHELTGGPGKAPSVSIAVNRDYIREQVIGSTIQLLDKGLIDKADAVRVVSQFFPDIADENWERFIATLTNEPKPPTGGVSNKPLEGGPLAEKLEPEPLPIQVVRPVTRGVRRR